MPTFKEIVTKCLREVEGDLTPQVVVTTICRVIHSLDASLPSSLEDPADLAFVQDVQRFLLLPPISHQSLYKSSSQLKSDLQALLDTALSVSHRLNPGGVAARCASLASAVGGFFSPSQKADDQDVSVKKVTSSYKQLWILAGLAAPLEDLERLDFSGKTPPFPREEKQKLA
jgi:hypothetical protein